MYDSKTFYDLFSSTYEQYSSGKKSYLSAVDTFIERGVRKREKGPVSLVDVGCGDGKRSYGLSRALKVQSLALIDNSDGMADLSEEIPNAKVFRKDISDLSFKMSAKYDVVLCLWNVLGHIPSPEKRSIAIKNLRDLLAEGGVLFIDVNNRYNIAHYGLFSVFRNICRDVFFRAPAGDFNLSIDNSSGVLQTSVHIFNPYEIESLFAFAGLKVVRREVISYKSGKRALNRFGGQLAYELMRI